MSKKSLITRLREDWSKGGFSVREQCRRAWAAVCLVSKDQRDKIYFFSVLGLILTIGMIVLPGKLSNGLSTIYSEHLAFKTIALLFAVCAILWAVLCNRPAKSSTHPPKAKTWCALKF